MVVIDRRTGQRWRTWLALLGAVGLTLAFTSALGAQVSIQPLPEDQLLVASDGLEFEGFGTSVAVDGDTMVVGAVSANATVGGRQGAAYVFTRTGNTWTETQKLTASDGQFFDAFGQSVAIDGDTIVIGAYQANRDEGAAYIFTRTGNTWTETQKLTAQNNQLPESFGFSVLIEGDTIIVGSPNFLGFQATGLAYVYSRSGNTWTETQILNAPDGQDENSFGESIAIDGDTIVIGAVSAGSTVDGIEGAAYIFTRTGEFWRDPVELTPANLEGFVQFGISVAIDGDRVVVGANLEGAAYIFTRTGNTWTETQKLTSPDPLPPDQFGISSDQFGNAVAIQGDTVVVANLSPGVAHVFTPTDNTWTQQQAFAPANADPQRSLELSLTLEGDSVFVGAPFLSRNNGFETGAVPVFEFDPDQPPLLVCNGEAITVDLAAGELPTSGRDVILGTDGDDLIDAGAGDDIICAQAGDDTINGGKGGDLIFGGDGADTIRSGKGPDVVDAGNGPDFVFAGKGKDVLLGGDGADELRGGNGDDTINGGRGSDVIHGGKDPDELRGGRGGDTINGGKGADELRGGNGADMLIGGNGPDSLRGGAGDDDLYSGDGVDDLQGGAGSDFLDAGRAVDTYDGGDGFDYCAQDPDGRAEQIISCEGEAFFRDN